MKNFFSASFKKQFDQCGVKGYPKQTLEIKDIEKLAKR